MNSNPDTDTKLDWQQTSDAIIGGIGPTQTARHGDLLCTVRQKSTSEWLWDVEDTAEEDDERWLASGIAGSESEAKAEAEDVVRVVLSRM